MKDLINSDRTTEENKAIKEWLSKGNKVTICPPNQETDPEKINYTYKVGFRGRKKTQSE